jgi:hypothetical protein
MDAWIIDKNNLAAAGGFDSQQTYSGGLRLIGDDGNFLPIRHSAELICRYWSSDQSYIAGPQLLFFSFFLAGMPVYSLWSVWPDGSEGLLVS